MRYFRQVVGSPGSLDIGRNSGARWSYFVSGNKSYFSEQNLLGLIWSRRLIHCGHWELFCELLHKANQLCSTENSFSGQNFYVTILMRDACRSNHLLLMMTARGWTALFSVNRKKLAGGVAVAAGCVRILTAMVTTVPPLQSLTNQLWCHRQIWYHWNSRVRNHKARNQLGIEVSQDTRTIVENKLINTRIDCHNVVHTQQWNLQLGPTKPLTVLRAGHSCCADVDFFLTFAIAMCSSVSAAAKRCCLLFSSTLMRKLC